MFVQKELREKNIAEYLLYMWQVEDMIRAAGLDSDRLYYAVIKGSGRSEADCREWRQWYDDLIEMMRTEGKTAQGHLQINENVLILLGDLHQRLLDSHKQQEYKDLYYKALPFIVEFRAKNHSTENEELRDALKANGIGRPSTRAAIIETLYKRQYISKVRKSLEPTPTGIALIGVIREELLKSAELTGQWEKKLRDIEAHKYSAQTFIEELKQMTAQIVQEVLADGERHMQYDAVNG